MPASARAPRPVWVRVIQPDPAGTMVLGSGFSAAAVLRGPDAFAAGTVEARLYDAGGGTLKLANAAGQDGAANLTRFRCLTDPAYAPGDEWIEVYEDTDLIGVLTPTSGSVDRGTITLQGEDGTTLLKRTRETTAGYWAHSPRDVIEHYGRAWRALVAEGFEASGPAFTYSTSPQTTADGRWDYIRCESDQAQWPGAVRMRSGGGGGPSLASKATFAAGTGAPDRYRPWRVDVEIVPGPISSGNGFNVAVWDGAVNVALVSLLYDQVAFATPVVGTGLSVRSPLALSSGVPLRLAIEGRDRWVYFTINGRVACVLPMGAEVNPGASYVTLDGPSGASGSAVQVRSVTLRVADRLLVNNRAGDYRLPGSPTPGGLWGEYLDANDLVAAYGPTDASTIMLNPTREPVASRLEAGLNYSSVNPPAWRPQGVPQDYFAARYTGSVYLDLDAADYAVRVTCDDEATVWVGRTRGGEHAAYATGSPGVGASNWLKSGSSSGSLPSGTTGPLAGMRSGWYPIVVELKQITGSAGIVLDWSYATPGGSWTTWTPIPAAKLSPYGVHRSLVRTESHCNHTPTPHSEHPCSRLADTARAAGDQCHRPSIIFDWFHVYYYRAVAMMKSRHSNNASCRTDE